MKVRLVHEIGRRLQVSFNEDIPNKMLGDVPLSVKEISEAKKMLNVEEDKLVEGGQSILGFGLIPIYDTETGELEPGCMYWNYWYPENMFWDNHKGPHLMVVLPNGDHWCIDSRASNCTMKDDRTHRCWCRHGEPPNVTVDKKGHTCKAGAGSIAKGNYHGFLRNGEFTK